MKSHQIWALYLQPVRNGGWLSPRGGSRSPPNLLGLSHHPLESKPPWPQPPEPQPPGPSSSKDIQSNLDDIRLQFEKKKKNYQRTLSPQNLKTKHKTHNFSTIIVSLGAIWVPKEAKFFKEVNFFGLMRCFSAKIEQTSKNRWKMTVLGQFWEFFEVYSI